MAEGEKKATILRALREGLSPKDVAEKIGCSTSYVYHMRKKWNAEKKKEVLRQTKNQEEEAKAERTFAQEKNASTGKDKDTFLREEERNKTAEIAKKEADISQEAICTEQEVVGFLLETMRSQEDIKIRIKAAELLEKRLQNSNGESRTTVIIDDIERTKENGAG